jgi:hypothetical protein
VCARELIMNHRTLNASVHLFFKTGTHVTQRTWNWRKTMGGVRVRCLPYALSLQTRPRVNVQVAQVRRVQPRVHDRCNRLKQLQQVHEQLHTGFHSEKASIASSTRLLLSLPRAQALPQSYIFGPQCDLSIPQLACSPKRFGQPAL